MLLVMCCAVFFGARVEFEEAGSESRFETRRAKHASSAYCQLCRLIQTWHVHLRAIQQDVESRHTVDSLCVVRSVDVDTVLMHLLHAVDKLYVLFPVFLSCVVFDTELRILHSLILQLLPPPERSS